MTLKDKLWARLRRVKVWMNWLLDRIIGFCNLVLMDVYFVPLSSFRSLIKKLVRLLGDFCWLLRDFPKMSAYRFDGSEFSIVFIGSRLGLSEVCEILFPAEKFEITDLGRIKVGHLRRQTRLWLDSDIGLVICELSRLYKRPMAPVDISVPLWIQQVIEIPENREMILLGSSRRDIRQRVNKACRSGFCYRFTKSKKEFDLFYRDMYLPYVKERHGALALVTPHRDLWKRWFRKGGLVLAIHKGEPVGGLVTFWTHENCFLIEVGVSPKYPYLRKNEINAFLFFSAIEMAHGLGCRKCDLGGSRAFLSYGPFRFKQEWGAQVVRRKRIYPIWRFLAKNIPESLRIQMNELSLISESKEGFWRVLVSKDDREPGSLDLKAPLREASKAGLRGMVVVRNGGKEYFSRDKMEQLK